MPNPLEFQPTDDAWASVLKKLCTSRIQISMVLTGGGSGVISRCLRRPGASLNFVEAVMPYSRQATQQYLGVEPSEGYASAQTAKALAQTAQRRAAALSDDPVHAFGIALTAALPTTHDSSDPSINRNCRIHVASKSTSTFRGWSLFFSGQPSEREVSEAMAEQMFLIAIQDSLQQSGLHIDSDPARPLKAAGLNVITTHGDGV